MSWLLLFGCAAAVMTLPFVPALVEWRRPQDIVPLHIDTQDALDPTWAARSFSERMLMALAQRRLRIGRVDIAAAPDRGEWPLDARERRTGVSRRVWHAAGAAALPPMTRFAAEVFAHGRLETSPRNVYRALWTRDELRLADSSVVVKWAQARTVVVGSRCRLQGRVSADESIVLEGRSTFSVLQAPVIRFNADSGAVAREATESIERKRHVLGLPPEVIVDGASGRGLCEGSLDLGSDRMWKGDLVCRADLAIGATCTARGSVKARGAIAVGDGCVIEGALVAEGPITLGADCEVRGSVVSETAVVLGAGCVIGGWAKPATVSAPRIGINPGVVVHGTVWAGEKGRMRAGEPIAAIHHLPRAAAAEVVALRRLAA